MTLAGVIVFLSVVTLDLAAGGACTLTVQPGMSIQEAIDTAPEGAVVCLAEGEWSTNLVITTTVVLRGEGWERSVVRGEEDDLPVLRVATDDSGRDVLVSVEGLAVVGAREQLGRWVLEADEPLPSACGIFVGGSGHAVIYGCSIVGHVDGIRLTGMSSAEISKSIVRGSVRYGVYSDSANEVSGTGNVMYDNGVDLARNVPGSLREPLVPATKDHIVYPDVRYPSLQHAVDALVCGGTLSLREGEHPAGVTIGRSMELVVERGAQVALVQGKSAGGRSGVAPVVSLVGGARVGFSGITVAGGRNGFLLGNDAEATLTACRVAGNSGSGVALRDVSRVTMTDTTVAYNARGICLRGAAHATVTRCLVLANGLGGGLALWDMSEAAIHASTIAREGAYAVRLHDTAVAVLADSQLLSNRHGIWLTDTSRVTITGCTLAHNTGFPTLFATDFSDATVVDAVISGNNALGAAFVHDSRGIVRRTTIVGNLHGMMLSDRADVALEDNIIHGNKGYAVFRVKNWSDAEGFIPSP